MRRYNNHERSSTLVNTCTAKADELRHQINTYISMNEAVTHSSLTDVFYSFFELTAARSAASPCGNVLTIMSIMCYILLGKGVWLVHISTLLSFVAQIFTYYRVVCALHTSFGCTYAIKFQDYRNTFTTNCNHPHSSLQAFTDRWLAQLVADVSHPMVESQTFAAAAYAAEALRLAVSGEQPSLMAFALASWLYLDV